MQKGKTKFMQIENEKIEMSYFVHTMIFHIKIQKKK